MRKTSVIAAVLLLCTLWAGLANATEETGSFVLFLAGTEAGGEDYWYSGEQLKAEGTISVSGQTIRITSVLEGSSGKWEQYQAAIRPGASYTAAFQEGELVAEIGPLKRSYPLEQPYVVLDNNVFVHYQQVLALLQDGRDELRFNVVVPSLVAANQNPILTGKVMRTGEAYYQVAGGEPFCLEEYVLVVAETLHIRLLGQGDRLIKLEIPMQAVEVVREGYVGLEPAQPPEDRPSHFRTEDFVVPNGEVQLAGSLSLPLGEGPFPVVLLNSGSGPQDRHGNTPPVYMSDLFKTMAEKLTEVGIAVLAYDERGVGESTGDYFSADLHDLLSDVEALLDYLDNHPEIDSGRKAMLGHSEGAYFAPLFAERLQALVLLAGSSITLDQLLVEQLAYQLSQPWLSAQERELLQQLQPQIEGLLAKLDGDEQYDQELQINLDWVRQHRELTPLANAAKVQSPVLIVHGDKDLKVMPYHAEALAEAVRSGGNNQVTVEILPGTTHEFLFFPLENEQYDPLNPLQVNPQLFEIVVSWLTENL